MDFGHDASDPMNYALMLKKYGSRKNLERAAAAGDMEAAAWRSMPSMMDRAAREHEARRGTPTVARMM